MRLARADGQDQLRSLAGAAAQVLYAQHQQVGAEAFRTGVGQLFLGG